MGIKKRAWSEVSKIMGSRPPKVVSEVRRMGQTIIDVDDNLRLVGTAHVSSASVTLVREQIDEYGPDLVAVELCESRLKSLKRPDDLANSDLLNIINEGRSSMILLQSALDQGLYQKRRWLFFDQF